MAVGAHFSTAATPAIVAMPTGTGKSGVMSLVPFVLAARRVLVVTPSTLLREQLRDEIAQLRVLRRTGVVTDEVGAPRAVSVTTRRTTSEQWEELIDFDLVVGTPNSLSPHNEGVIQPPADLFDVVIFDEAHHTPAPSYNALIEAFPSALVVLFTATPFRRDRKPLPGESVYTFSLAQALEEGILAPIDFIPVEVPIGSDQPAVDRALAEVAKNRMNEQSHIRADSRIIARTSTIAHARELLPIYRGQGLQMGLITNTSTQRQVRETLQKLRDGDLAGLVSVGVLGEGFDFPQLKIGVYHHPHASLAPTLQFLGRISRVLEPRVTAELIATRASVTDETRDLYVSDIAWSELIPAIADAATATEAERRSYTRGFAPTPSQPLSTGAVRPRKDVQVYQVGEATDVDLRQRFEVIAGGGVVYHGVDADGDLAVVISEHLERPEWLDADTLDSLRYELHVVFHDRASGLLFIHGTRDGSIRQLRDQFGLSGLNLVDPIWIDRLLTSIAVAGYHSVGMRSARAPGGRLAAYRMMAGPSVGSAVTAAETRSYGTGHTIARVYDPMSVTSDDLTADGRITASITSLGVSYGRGKVFSPDLAQLFDFRRWCLRLSELVRAQGDATPSGPPDLALLSPRRIHEFPEAPYMALLEPTIVGSSLHLLNGATGEICPIEEVEFTVERTQIDQLTFTGKMPDGDEWTGSMTTSGGWLPTAFGWQVLSGNEQVPVELFLTDTPLTVYYPDGTSSIGGILFQPRSSYPPIDPDAVVAWSFAGTDITAEHQGAGLGQLTVKEWVLGQVEPDFDFIVDDDRAGEIADLVLIRDAGSYLRVRLLHLKASSRADHGARVADFYELLGQASRSVIWCQSSRWTNRLSHRLATGSYLHRGNLEDLQHLLTDSTDARRPIRWEIGVVQPGMTAHRVNEVANISTMLNDFVDWTAQHDVQARMYFHG